MLTNYSNDTRRLLQNPPAPVSLYSAIDMLAWINKARGQLAGEGECIRVLGTVNTVVGQRVYNFSDINVGVPATSGVQAPIHVRSITYNVGLAGGQRWIPGRPWEWFSLYNLSKQVPVPGVPTAWSQFGQGAATAPGGTAGGGSFYIDPPPDAIYTLNCDCVCFPIQLVDDSTIEAIPFLWTDAVPFFAAYLALMSAQNNARTVDAERMFDNYTTFVERARKASNPSVSRWQFEQAGDPTQANKLGLQKPAAQGGG